MLEVRQDKPIDPTLWSVLDSVRKAAIELKLDFFVGGAMARDIVLVHVLGERITRATRDVDLGFYINDWDEFSNLKAKLIQSGEFVEVEDMAQRLHYRNSVPLDLIPFGGIAEKDELVSWPPGHEVVLNVAGFADALRASIAVSLGSGLVVKTCSLPSLATLKLLAWKDRGHENNKDATDFLLIAQRYGPAQNADRLYETETALLYQASGDPELAGAELLGRDAAAQCRKGSAAQVQRILDDPRGPVYKKKALKQRR